MKRREFIIGIGALAIVPLDVPESYEPDVRGWRFGVMSRDVGSSALIQTHGTVRTAENVGDFSSMAKVFVYGGAETVSRRT